MNILSQGTLLAVFVLSGATSLAYETIWIRVLSLGVGSTSAAMSLVLAVFFGGLSVGSYLSGKWANKIRNPLFLYAALETGIGIYALLILNPLFGIHHVLAKLPLDSTFGWVGLLTKGTIVAGLLAIPTIAMGATLPLLVGFFLKVGGTIGRSTSLLYGINTLGAVVGSLVTAFWLLPNAGILHTNQIAVATNVLIAIAAVLLGKTAGANAAVAATTEPVDSNPEIVSDGLRRNILALAGVSGFVSIAAEVVWNKYLGIYFGNNVYGLGLVLGLTLIGMAVGSLALSRFIHRIKRPVSTFAQLQLASIALLLLASYGLNWAPLLVAYFQHYTNYSLNLLWAKSLVVTAFLFVPMCLFGVLLPLAITLLTQSRSTAPEWVGKAYAINTIGAILGSWIAGIVLIPHVGSSWTLRLALLVAIASLIGLIRRPELRPQLKPMGAAMALLAFLVAFLPTLDFSNILKSAYHRSTAASAQEFKEEIAKYSPSYEEFKLIVEGETGVISLSHDPKDGPYYQKYLRLKTNGLNESVYNSLAPNTLPKYEALIALLPYALVPNPKRAFVVGYGGGFTVDFLTSTPLERVNVVELEKGILAAANYAHKGNNPLLVRPNLNLQIEDARFMLATNRLGQHDIIISQPSHSWLAGAANLFTKEFFEIVRGGLSDQGVFSQWLNLYNMDVTVLKSILATFYSVFPHGAVFTNEGDEELVLIGSVAPISFNWQRLEQLAASPAFREKLGEIPLTTPHDLITHFSFSREKAIAISAGAQPNLDSNAFAETRQSRLFYEASSDSETPQQFLAKSFQADFGGIVPSIATQQSDFYYNVLASVKKENQHTKFFPLLQQYESRQGSKPSEAWNLGYVTLKAQRYASAEKYLKKAFRGQKQVGILNLLLSAYSESRRTEKMLPLLESTPLRDDITDCYRGEALLTAASSPVAVQHFGRLTLDIARYTKSCGDYFNRIVGEFYYARGDYSTAVAFLSAYNNAYRHDPRALSLLADAYQKLGQTESSQLWLSYAKSEGESERQSLKETIAFYRFHGLVDDASALEARLNAASSLAE